MNNNFSLIARSDGELLLLMFENEHKKEKVFFTIQDKKLKMIYSDNQKVTFNLNNQESKVLKTRNKILVTEMNCKDSVSNGKIKNTYVMEKMA